MADPKGGYFGKMPKIDLTSGKTAVRPLDEGILRDYTGGGGAVLGSKNVKGIAVKGTRVVPNTSDSARRSGLFYTSNPCTTLIPTGNQDRHPCESRPGIFDRSAINFCT